ncbi:4-coumarate--CoA ligase-like 9 [Prosopis cineraria]|uniref:4-coumarate--CoA ligase-like 9 n=1 Tax=Prosopis cineraria TaxID=364024 RepID=UPI00240F71AB|nr:4-coumarate--CoA ligase-like 9 [Prosopis cineraria]
MISPSLLSERSTVNAVFIAMANQSQAKPSLAVDPNSGFCLLTRTFHSLRPDHPVPPLSQPLSIADYACSLLPTSVSSTTVLIDSVTGRLLSYSLFLRQVKNLASSLVSLAPLSKGHVAFILSPSSLHIPVLYFSLLSLGVIVSPANPLSSDSEVAHQVQLVQPVIAFATSSTAHKIPNLQYGTILLDSPQFLSMIDGLPGNVNSGSGTVEVSQSDTAAILFSSGTTGRVKGALLTHGNFISVISGLHYTRHLNSNDEARRVYLFPLPLFHVFGFFALISSVAAGDTVVLMRRFDFGEMLKAVERYKITTMPVSPPLVVALTKSEFASKYDLSSLRFLGCGGAPLGKEVAENFKVKFPNVEISEGYGLTESSGLATRMIGPEETKRHGSVGRLEKNFEAKIVDSVSGEALPPGKKGELWLRGPTIMKGYVADETATTDTLDSEGWLKTGDLCYFDSHGFLFIVDRIKELIKYKAYQVPPAELELLLLSHPEIADAAVIPYPDEDAGQIPMAFVVRKSGSNIIASEVMDFVAKQVAPYKKIRRLSFVNNIPKSASGKILRRELVTYALNGSVSSKL